ncbi:hypothetical protein CHS0354_035148 [Potamilus streckersoni]|uniref:Uncharacterized protein n=1 Tax=Potamilus streckersoni TaxID=2493646 RepID=A0AAE0WBJ1_9BIVA|nr:hypothetical protein CHS0354_035148 [Potamilus streckersoni]
MSKHKNELYLQDMDILFGIIFLHGTGYRQQQNEETSYIDGSTVYGSTDDQLSVLRDRVRFMFPGKKVYLPNRGGVGWAAFHNVTIDRDRYMITSNKYNLPRNPKGTCTLNKKFEFCHNAGHSEVNQVPSLTSFHTLFVNEHNRIVDALSKVNPTWDANKLFQEARKINIAQLQHIIYNGFLKAILSPSTMSKYKLRSHDDGYNNCYDIKRDASISNEFGIAYRMGHTWIPTYQDLYIDLHTRQTGRETGPFDIVRTFNNPHLIFLNQRTGSQGILKWLISEAAPTTDRIVENSARNRLFQNFTTNESFDLASLNINRGRDHGIPPYGKHRESCRLSALSANWNSLVDHHSTDITLLRKVYDDPRDIDLFTGALTERRETSSELGPTLNCILGREFQNLKEGDSYWYERPKPQGFSTKQLNEIRKTSLSAVLCAYLDLKEISKDAFKLPGDSNPIVRCKELPSIDLTKWKVAS